ncbi:cobalamin biosynthesis protein CobQ [Rhodobacterales bacterium HKCCE2091]|nr:cobalamin biosynthesis protein CobQ [Rhodobacterales bacterium HKCCE2091]
MNTPAHMALGLAVLGRRARAGEVAAILAGGLLPDAFLFAEHFLRGNAGLIVLADAFNSVFLYAAAALVAWQAGPRWLLLLSLAALLHIAFDLPLHAGDAHRHFWPLDWRFESPVSFWDEAHHGRVFGTLEGLLFAACIVVIWRRSGQWWTRALTVAFAAVYGMAFVHFIGHAFADQHWAVW